MKLDRHINIDKRGKYALVKLRRLDDWLQSGAFAEVPQSIKDALKTLEDAGMLDYGTVGTESEFFVMRLKDKYAASGLYGYANAAAIDDEEYAEEVEGLARRAGPACPFCKKPD